MKKLMRSNFRKKKIKNAREVASTNPGVQPSSENLTPTELVDGTLEQRTTVPSVIVEEAAEQNANLNIDSNSGQIQTNTKAQPEYVKRIGAMNNIRKDIWRDIWKDKERLKKVMEEHEKEFLKNDNNEIIMLKNIKTATQVAGRRDFPELYTPEILGEPDNNKSQTSDDSVSSYSTGYYSEVSPENNSEKPPTLSPRTSSKPQPPALLPRTSSLPQGSSSDTTGVTHDEGMGDITYNNNNLSRQPSKSSDVSSVSQSPKLG